MSKRVWKLQDFVAHSGRVHCARLGEKSGQVLATGGDDKRVNIWKVGKPHAMMSLAGHSSAVECLVFDKQEEVLVAGCAGGSMQVWNLEYRKMAGTLTGHRMACNSFEFHPYGEFFASGSADTNLKIWDLRRKSCIQTYKGHSGAITSIRFSPHGRWVATGGQDSQVKIWDLTAGKLMRDLDDHKGPITSLAFHPKEYLLASGSADRTMKLWSLERFNSIATTAIGSSSVQAVKFYVEEQAVLSASHDALRLFSTDGLSAPLDTIDVDWRGLQDMRLCLPEEKLIGISIEGSQLGIWVADLQKREAGAVKPIGGNFPRQPARASVLAGGGNHGNAAKQQAPRQRPGSGDFGTDDEGRVEQHEQPPQRVRSPAPRLASGYEDMPRPSRTPQDVQAQRGAGSPKACGSAPPRPRSPPPLSEANEPAIDQAFPDRKRDDRRDDRSRAQEHHFQRGTTSPKALDGHPPAAFGDLGLGPSPVPEQAVPSYTPIVAPARSSVEDRGIKSPMAKQTPQPPLSEATADQVSQLAQQHPQMMGVLQRRHAQVRRVKELWAQGNLSNLSQGLQFPQDHAVVCDFARAVMREKMVGALNLDACQTLLPIMRDLMCSKYDDFGLTGHQFAELLLHHFGDLISETRQSCARIPERQLDLAREERLRKCNACHQQFREIQRSLLDSRLASRFASFRESLQTFLQRSG